FGVQWEQRETTVSERFTYEIKTYETIEEIEEIEEIVEENVAVAIVAREQEAVSGDKLITSDCTTFTTVIKAEDVVVEQVQTAVIVDDKKETEAVKEVSITKVTGVAPKPAVTKETSWFRKIASATGAAVVGAGAVAVGAGALAVGAVHDAASGAGHAASGALTKVDGVWKRT
ncbi:hypothetical protein EC991_000810, partial [Linnemannia zychae]